MLLVVVFAVLALAQWFPETWIGGAFRRLLIDGPARWLNRLKRGHVLLALVVFAVLGAAYVIGREAGVLVAGQAAADGLAFAMAVDLATWLDMMAIALVLAVTVRFREVIRLAALQVKRRAGVLAGVLISPARARARRARPTRPPRQGEDPDRPAPALAWA